MTLASPLFGNPLQHWLTALAIALAINLLVGLIKWAVTQRLAKIAAQTDTAVDDALIAILARTRQFLIFGITLFVGSHYLDLPARVETVLRSIATLAVFLQIGLWFSGALNFGLERYRRRALSHNAGATTSLAALGFIGSTVLWTVVLLLALDNLGVDVTALVAGLGVGGIAVALAVQNILGDLFASLSIVIDKPFVVGDAIVVDTYSGTVEHVGLKTTRLRSVSGEQLVFSNSDLLKARLRNYKRMQERRVVFTFGVLYQTDPSELENIPTLVKVIIAARSTARFDRAHLVKLGESSLDYEVVYWMRTPDYGEYMDVQQAINLALLRAFAERRIGFAYPTRSILVENPLQLQRARPAPAAAA